MRYAADGRDDELKIPRSKKQKRPALNPLYQFIEFPTEFPHQNPTRPPIPSKWDSDDQYRRESLESIQWSMNSNALSAEQKTARREQKRKLRQRLLQDHPLSMAKRRMKRDARKNKE